jgi:hypothetical protein
LHVGGSLDLRGTGIKTIPAWANIKGSVIR